MVIETTSEERQSAGYKVFHSQIEVLLPQYAAASRVDEALYGTPKLRDRDLEMQIAHSDVHTMRTIAQLALLHAQGVDIKLVKVTKAIFIYTQIVRHMQAMADFINREVDFAGDDLKARMLRIIEDLDMLQAFAEKIKPKAIQQLPKTADIHGLRSRLSRLSVMSRHASPALQLEHKHTLGVGDVRSVDDLLTSNALARVRTIED